MSSEEVLYVGRVDPPCRSELVAGQLPASDPVANGPITHCEEGGKGSLSEEGGASCFPLHATYVQRGRRLHRPRSWRFQKTEGQTPAAPPYRRPPHGEAVPKPADRRGG